MKSTVTSFGNGDGAQHLHALRRGDPGGGPVERRIRGPGQRELAISAAVACRKEDGCSVAPPRRPGHLREKRHRLVCLRTERGEVTGETAPLPVRLEDRKHHRLDDREVRELADLESAREAELRRAGAGRARWRVPRRCRRLHGWRERAASRLMRAVLPAPMGPMSAWRAPCGSEKLTSLTAASAPKLRERFSVRSAVLIDGSSRSRP